MAMMKMIENCLLCNHPLRILDDVAFCNRVECNLQLKFDNDNNIIKYAFSYNKLIIRVTLELNKAEIFAPTYGTPLIAELLYSNFVKLQSKILNLTTFI